MHRYKHYAMAASHDIQWYRNVFSLIDWLIIQSASTHTHTVLSAIFQVNPTYPVTP